MCPGIYMVPMPEVLDSVRNYLSNISCTQEFSNVPLNVYV